MEEGPEGKREHDYSALLNRSRNLRKHAAVENHRLEIGFEGTGKPNIRDGRSNIIGLSSVHSISLARSC